MISQTTKCQWWGYRHVNGSIQAKRWFDARDLPEARASLCVVSAAGPFYADGREEALKMLEKLV